MGCKKLRRILPKYMDGDLSERRSALVEEHIRDCSACAAELRTLEKMRSLLRTAGEAGMPDAYWGTYWERLEKKLPDKPLPFSLSSRIWNAVAVPLRQPAAVSRIAAYIILLAFLAYMAPNHPFKSRKSPQMSARMPAKSVTKEGIDELALYSRLGEDKAKDATPLASRQMSEMGIDDDGSMLRKNEVLEGLAGSSIEKEELAEFAPAKPGIAAGQLLEEPQDDNRNLVLGDLADSKDEYIAAERYFQKGEYLQAIPSYQNFIEANVHDERAFRAKYQIGESYYQVGNYSDALSNFAVLTDPTDSEEKELQDSDTDFYFYETEGRKAIVASKPRARGKIGIVARGSGTKAKAAELSRAEARPDVSSSHAAGYVIARPETREELISRAIFRQAQSYENLGKVQEALTKYNRYIEGYPQGEYVPQAKEKIEKIGKEEKEKKDEK